MLEILAKNDLTIIGIMTGTSMDGIDISVSHFTSPNNLTLLAYKEYDFPKNLKTKIEKMIAGNVSLKDLSQLNFYLANLYHQSILKLLNESKILIDDIDAIGIHGQTLWHQPKPDILLENSNLKIKSTLQLGSGPVLSKLIDKPVISNFREADMAVGGEGAPLIPIFDFNFLKSDSENRITLNIGGISNITFMPKDCTENELIAFDCGPGNSLIDLAMSEYFDYEYDQDGEIAYSGNIIEELFDELSCLDFINRKPPKSTGKEEFGETLFSSIKDKFINYDGKDIVHTLSVFTAYSIAENIKNFTNDNSKIIVSGGGVYNKFILEQLSVFLPKAEIIKLDDIGINSSAKESICFGYLAYRTLNGLSSNLPSVTGANKKVILGMISI